MKFKVKDMDIATGGKMVAILHKRDAEKLDFHSSDRVLLRVGKREIVCILDVSESFRAVPEGKVGLYEEVLDKLKVRSGRIVEVLATGKPESVVHIRDKLYGKRLGYQELYHIMDDITNNRLTDIEKTYFVSGGFTYGWNIEEVVDMTRAMVATGDRLKFRGVTLDKHSIGGVPGNRTTMVIIPIIAAAGFTIPKTSSRAITSPAGTADTMECLARVELPEGKIKGVVKKTGACIVHGGSMNLAPADDRIIEVEHPLSIDAEGQLLASVMAKKHSVTANHVLIDIPMGKSTKAHNWKQAKKLKKLFIIIGKRLGINVKVIITDGSHPIGRGVGPLLEANDVMAVLRNDILAPADLRKKSLLMASTLLQMTGRYNKRESSHVAKEILDSGKALSKMREIIAAQGKIKKPKLGENKYLVRSGKVGRIGSIDNKIIAKIARMAGAPADKGAGLYLHKHIHEIVNKREPLYTIYAKSKFKLELAKEFLRKNNGFVIG